MTLYVRESSQLKMLYCFGSRSIQQVSFQKFSEGGGGGVRASKQSAGENHTEIFFVKFWIKITKL